MLHSGLSGKPSAAYVGSHFSHTQQCLCRRLDYLTSPPPKGSHAASAAHKATG